MKKSVFTSLLLFFGYISFSQLYIKNNTFVKNNSQLVFVKQAIHLEPSALFFLRNKAQLIQGKTGVSANSGLGKLSVFQEGTSNAYTYNYWCSPVGNPADLENKFGILLLNRPTSAVLSSPITTTLYDGSTSTSSLVVAKYWIWKYLTSNGYNLNQPNGWIHVEDAQTLKPGEGFTMKGVSGTDITNVSESTLNNPGNKQRYDFRGKPNDGDILVPVDVNDYTLTGNPYPSAMNVSKFLLDPVNAACTGIAYYWEQNKNDNSHVLAAYRGGYGTYAPVSAPYTGIYVPATFNTYNSDGSLNTTGSSSGLSIERKYAPIGQGFMIKGDALGSVTIKNEYREYVKEDSGLSQFEKNIVNQNVTYSSQTVPHLRFDITFNNQYTRQLGLILIPQATDLVDRGIDAKSPSEESLPNDVYFYLDNSRYVIEGIPFDVNKRIKLGVKSSPNVNFTFKLSHIINFNQNQDVYIFDALTQTYHNIKNGDYSVVLPGGVINNRFEITFTTSALNSQNITASQISVFHNNSTQNIIIQNPNLIDLQYITVFDISGKLIFEKRILNTQLEYQFSTSYLSEGVYVVNLKGINELGVSEKIIIKRDNN